MAEIRLCGRCKKSISQADLESGVTTERYGQLVCQECTAMLGRKKEKGFDELSFFYESILNEVKSIKRILTYETGSWLNIIAAVAQCFVFGTLIFAYINRHGDLHSTLLLAVVFQLMALTFFVIKK
ncbi:MAG: hypothetical protein MRK01_07570 [Candidatus Scalindua sp.]|nr:hypothetical protein [Candidatus Scalindua sp.]